MTMFNQSQIKEMIVSTVAGVASVAAADGRKILYCMETKGWYFSGSTGTVDNTTVLQGSGTKWELLPVKVFPPADFAAATSYAKGAFVNWKGRYLLATAAATAAAVPDKASWTMLFNTVSNVYSAWSDVEVANGEVYSVNSIYYRATDFISKNDTEDTKRKTKSVAIYPSLEVVDYTTGGTYAKGQVVKYKTLFYRVSKLLADAPATPSLKADGSGDLEISLDRIPSTMAIAAVTGNLGAPAVNTTYICKNQYDGILTQTVYRYYIGTLTTDLTEALTGLSNLRILSANFHVETYLGEARTGTKTYDEFITHNNDGDESRVRAISEDGTKLQIQQGTNIKIVGGWIDFAATKSGFKVRSDIGL